MHSLQNAFLSQVSGPNSDDAMYPCSQSIAYDYGTRSSLIELFLFFAVISALDIFYKSWDFKKCYLLTKMTNAKTGPAH